jgi:2-polyprenyl-6-methoxyphenol hydroxylase-like FAD-dependent oxidoreductase
MTGTTPEPEDAAADAPAANTSAPTHSDVLILGGGLAGAATAVVLARRGMSVTLVDRYAVFPPIFRAEKIEPDQADLLRKLELFEAIEPHTRPISEVIHARNGRVVYRRRIEQFGISYCDIVNNVRTQIPSGVDFRIGVVKSLVTDGKEPGIVMTDGTRHTGRLLVIAAGMNNRLAEELGARRHMLMQELSMAFGFMLEAVDGKPFSFDAVTYRSFARADRMGFLTLFGMGSLMRGNLFTYWPVNYPDTREMVKEPTAVLRRLFGGLEDVIGAYRVAGKVEPFRIDLYRMDAVTSPGVVVVGDAFQSVCPSTGRGLSKVLTDVDVLCNECIPAWWGKPELGAELVAGFYRHPRKVEVDADALNRALRNRGIAIGTSLRSRIRRLVQQWRFDRGG